MINEDSINLLVEKLPSFAWSDNEFQERESLRGEFISTYNERKIAELTKDDYFAGRGRKQGCIAYDLEWGTRILGSIKGGSNYKYGYEIDFDKIKLILQKILAVHNAYLDDGNPSVGMSQIVDLSKEINGFKTGRTVIPKLLSIYYPEAFLPIFNDQDLYVSKLLVNGLESENTGLALYLEYNWKLLAAKTRLNETIGRAINNFEFASLLYHAFPKQNIEASEHVFLATDVVDEKRFDALEVQHYQTLLHRNFNRLFPNLRYVDETAQKPRNGQYDTQTVGIIDLLAIDEHNDFVVIEIKRHATDKTIGQILRYMGWVKEELCTGGQKVKGLIVAERKDTQLEFALKVIPDVSFMKLTLDITLAAE